MRRLSLRIEKALSELETEEDFTATNHPDTKTTLAQRSLTPLVKKSGNPCFFIFFSSAEDTGPRNFLESITPGLIKQFNVPLKSLINHWKLSILDMTFTFGCRSDLEAVCGSLCF